MIDLFRDSFSEGDGLTVREHEDAVTDTAYLLITAVEDCVASTVTLSAEQIEELVQVLEDWLYGPDPDGGGTEPVPITPVSNNFTRGKPVPFFDRGEYDEADVKGIA